MRKKSDREVPLPNGLVPLLSQRELETYYGISDWTANKWVRDGCPVERLPGGSRRFNLTDVIDWLAEQTAEAEATASAKSRRALAARSA